MKTQTYNYDFLIHRFHESPICVFYKDIRGCFLGCNVQFATSFGFSKPENLIGKNDHVLPIFKRDADKYREDDRCVIYSKNPKINIEEQQNFVSGYKSKKALTSKIPVFNDRGDVFGTLGCYFDITNIVDLYQLYKLKILLNMLITSIHQYPREFGCASASKEMADFIDHVFHFIDTHFYEFNEPEKNKKPLKINLTSKELESLNLLIRGKTIRQIGELLNRSPRTIETHINNAKQKLGVHTKSELIDKAVKLKLVSIKTKTFLF